MILTTNTIGEVTADQVYIESENNTCLLESIDTEKSKLIIQSNDNNNNDDDDTKFSTSININSTTNNIIDVYLGTIPKKLISSRNDDDNKTISRALVVVASLNIV